MKKLICTGHIMYKGKPARLEEVDYSPESLNVEKLDEMPDYETTNRVSRSNRISTTINIINPSGQLYNPNHPRIIWFQNKYGKNYLR